MLETFEALPISEEDMAVVEQMKFRAAQLEDLIMRYGMGEIVSTESYRMQAIARTKLEECILWAVKAVSRK